MRQHRHYRDWLNDRGVPDEPVVQLGEMRPAPPPSSKIPKPRKTNIN